MGFKTWLESLKSRFEGETLESLLHEMPHVFGFTGEIPEPIAFLRGANADMGFEDIGNNALRNRLERAFAGTGVVIPGTGLKMRFIYPTAEIEPLDGSETESLPIDWKTYLTLFTGGGKTVFTWIGKNVRQDRFHGIDLSRLTDTEDGWSSD